MIVTMVYTMMLTMHGLVPAVLIVVMGSRGVLLATLEGDTIDGNILEGDILKGNNRGKG